MKKTLTINTILILLVAGFFAWRYFSALAQQQEVSEYDTQPIALGSLTSIVGATGTVRSNQSAWLTWDTSGTVAQVDVFSGMQVARGDELASLEQTSLSQNVILAQADLVSAQQALENLYDTDLQLAQALQSVEDAQQALDDLFNPELQQALALKSIADAAQAVDDAEYDLSSIQSTSSQADIDAQKAQVILAEAALDKARDKYEPYADKPEDNLTRANLLAKLSAAQETYDDAVADLNWMKSDTPNALDLAVIEAELATAQAQLLEAERDYEEIKDGPSEADIALAEANLSDAQENYADIFDGPNPDDIAAAEARVAAAEATLTQIAVSAPFDGEITAVKALPGDQISPGTAAFRLDDLSRLLVDVEVSEVDINQVQIGQSVNLAFDAVIGAEYEGQVIEVSKVGESEQGVVYFLVTVELLNPDEPVKPGMSTSVTIEVSELENILLVPSQAVRTVEEDLVVYIMQDGIPAPVQVTLGASAGSFSEVLSGNLSEGDLLVLNPPNEPLEVGIGSGRPEGADGIFGGGG